VEGLTTCFEETSTFPFGWVWNTHSLTACSLGLLRSQARFTRFLRAFQMDHRERPGWGPEALRCGWQPERCRTLEVAPEQKRTHPQHECGGKRADQRVPNLQMHQDGAQHQPYEHAGCGGDRLG
jgi:hypothetical protein